MLSEIRSGCTCGDPTMSISLWVAESKLVDCDTVLALAGSEDVGSVASRLTSIHHCVLNNYATAHTHTRYICMCTPHTSNFEETLFVICLLV